MECRWFDAVTAFAYFVSCMLRDEGPRTTNISQSGVYSYDSTLYRPGKPVVTSIATKSDGAPIFQLDPMPTGSTSTLPEPMFTARVWTLDYLNKLLEVAASGKLKEIQEVVECK